MRYEPWSELSTIAAVQLSRFHLSKLDDLRYRVSQFADEDVKYTVIINPLLCFCRLCVHFFTVASLQLLSSVKRIRRFASAPLAGNRNTARPPVSSTNIRSRRIRVTQNKILGSLPSSPPRARVFCAHGLYQSALSAGTHAHTSSHGRARFPRAPDPIRVFWAIRADATSSLSNPADSPEETPLSYADHTENGTDTTDQVPRTSAGKYAILLYNIVNIIN